MTDDALARERAMHRRAVAAIKDQMEGSKSWRRIMSMSGRHYYENRKTKARVVIELTDENASVKNISPEGPR